MGDAPHLGICAVTGGIRLYGYARTIWRPDIRYCRNEDVGITGCIELQAARIHRMQYRARPVGGDALHIGGRDGGQRLINQADGGSAVSGAGAATMGTG
jgi:hypothetical protein